MTRSKVFSVIVRHLPEGVWQATSPEIPGLHIEGETVEEVQDEARAWAPELLIDNGILEPDTDFTLAFQTEPEPLAQAR